MLVRVAAAGVGPWDAWMREGKSVLRSRCRWCRAPIFPALSSNSARGSAIERPVTRSSGSRIIGAYAEYAVADSGTIAGRPARIGDAEAASLRVVATTPWQMVFDHARVAAGQHVLVQGGAGNVGAFAVQLAAMAGRRSPRRRGPHS